MPQVCKRYHRDISGFLVNLSPNFLRLLVSFLCNLLILSLVIEPLLDLSVIWIQMTLACTYFGPETECQFLLCLVTFPTESTDEASLVTFFKCDDQVIAARMLVLCQRGMHGSSIKRLSGIVLYFVTCFVNHFSICSIPASPKFLRSAH